ncbi:MAG: lipoyl(octanoyl) transferase LipB [Planctomycetota bacterium]
MRRSGRLEIWGRVGYEEAHARQLRLVEQRRRDAIADTLILCEHDPVITAGRAWRGSLPRDLPYPVRAIERGGELTYHGPGQLVGYPIFRLEGERHDLSRYLDSLQGALVGALARLGVVAAGRTGAGARGVWVADRKIASIGVAVRHWVTYHGFALNVQVDPGVFTCIRPCGLDPAVMTSLHLVRPQMADMRLVTESVIESFAARFDLSFDLVGSPGSPIRHC